MSVNGASTIIEYASCIIQRQWNVGNPQWTHPQPLLANMLVMILRPPPTVEHLQSVNSFCGGSERYTAMNSIVLFLNWVLHGQSLQSNLVYNFTNMHAISYRSDFLLEAVELIFENPQCAVLCHYFRQDFEPDYSAVYFVTPCGIHILWTPHCSRLWSLRKTHLSLFVIWATLLYKSSSMLGGHQRM